jgi:hypothetical protein
MYVFQSEVNAIKWDPTGSFLASCSDDWTAKVPYFFLKWSCPFTFTDGSLPCSLLCAKMVQYMLLVQYCLSVYHLLYLLDVQLSTYSLSMSVNHIPPWPMHIPSPTPPSKFHGLLTSNWFDQLLPQCSVHITFLILYVFNEPSKPVMWPWMLG